MRPTRHQTDVSIAVTSFTSDDYVITTKGEGDESDIPKPVQHQVCKCSQRNPSKRLDNKGFFEKGLSLGLASKGYYPRRLFVVC